MSLTQELSRFISGLRFEDVLQGALSFIRIGFTDTFATLAAGRGSDGSAVGVMGWILVAARRRCVKQCCVQVI